MWVFGYGSLMWDGWQTSHGCICTVKASLPQYIRAFNKASVRNWGTPQHPGPTLNIISKPAESCVGIAFEFPDNNQAGVMAALQAREGRSFALSVLEVILEDGVRVQAVTPHYTGPNLIGNMPLAQRAAMARVAVGTDGSCANYVSNIAARLAALGIDDPVVREFAEAVQQCRP